MPQFSRKPNAPCHFPTFLHTATSLTESPGTNQDEARLPKDLAFGISSCEHWTLEHRSLEPVPTMNFFMATALLRAFFKLVVQNGSHGRRLFRLTNPSSSCTVAPGCGAVPGPSIMTTEAGGLFLTPEDPTPKTTFCMTVVLLRTHQSRSDNYAATIWRGPFVTLTQLPSFHWALTTDGMLRNLKM